ncbi:MAG: hypothetical protein Q8N00_11315 [Nitrospirota bacterium]|nr:hypothetical protein [Nitrospirota bacterium]MDP3597135.1 hypothetical protein [Nitrospirota bacterium]
MLKEFVEKILSLAEVNLVTIGTLDYTDRALHVVAPPCLAGVSLLTLTGLVDLIQCHLDALKADDWVLHVGSHADVSLLHRATDAYGRRVRLASVKLDDGQPFPFGRFLNREEFVIGLHSQFVQSPDQQGVVKLCSNLEVSTVVMAEDDGISQRTTVKQGISLKETVTVKGRVCLQPYRTFREIEQPASDFIFRLKSRDGAVPDCALFEADGGKWKLDAVLAIKTWLESKNLGMPVMA